MDAPPRRAAILEKTRQFQREAIAPPLLSPLARAALVTALLSTTSKDRLAQALTPSPPRRAAILEKTRRFQRGAMAPPRLSPMSRAAYLKA